MPRHFHRHAFRDARPDEVPHGRPSQVVRDAPRAPGRFARRLPGSLYDIRVLFLLDGGHSDAEAMATLFLLPSWLWASAWMLMSVGMLGWTLWTTRARTSRRREAEALR